MKRICLLLAGAALAVCVGSAAPAALISAAPAAAHASCSIRCPAWGGG